MTTRYIRKSYEVDAIPVDEVIAKFTADYQSLPEWLRTRYEGGTLTVSAKGLSGVVLDTREADVGEGQWLVWDGRSPIKVMDTEDFGRKFQAMVEWTGTVTANAEGEN